MAIFQPTNIIPSSFTQGTVDAEKDNMEISWQVNGNSAMTAFQVDFYLNDYASTPVYSTGKLPKAGEEPSKYNLPFYGTDRFGRPQFFTWSPKESWNDWSSKLTNGNNYKFKITQYYIPNPNEYSITSTKKLSPNMGYYFVILIDDTRNYVRFIAPSAIAQGTTFYYNLNTKKGWYIENNQKVEIQMNYNTDAATEVVNEDNNNATNEVAIQQTSFSTFITRAKPSLTINSSTSNEYNNEVPFPDSNGEFHSSIGYFVADYKQEQGDPIRWIRWQVASATYNSEIGEWILGDILADTGDIYTPTLNYEFNGFFNSYDKDGSYTGNGYAIRCFGESESGQQTNSDLTTDGWIYFNINYGANTYEGNFTAQCLHKENATLLEWESVEVINGNYTKPEGSDAEYTFQNNSVFLPANSSITWDKVGSGNSEEDINFLPPWTAVWKGNVNSFDIRFLTYFGSDYSPSISDCSFSPDGKLWVAVGQRNGTVDRYRGAEIYTINGEQPPTLLWNNNTEIQNLCCAFSPDGKLLVIQNNVYSVEDSNIQLLSTLPYMNGYFTCAFSPDGKLFVRGGVGVEIWSVDGDSFAFVSNLTKNGIKFDNVTNTCAFSPDGKLLAVGGYGDGLARAANLFSVSGEQITFLTTLDASTLITDLSFNPAGTLLATVSLTFKKISLYAINNDTATFLQSISLMNDANEGGDFTLDGEFYINPPYVYAVNGNKLDFYGKIFDDDGNDVHVNFFDINPSNSLLVGGAHNFYPPYRIYSLRNKVEPQGDLFNIQTKNNNNIKLLRQETPFVIMSNNNVVGTFDAPFEVNEAAFIFNNSDIYGYFYDANGLVTVKHIEINYEQDAISAISIFGGNSGTTVNSVSVYDNTTKTFDISNYQSPNFEPVWNDNSYDLYMTANFNGNIQGGTGNAEGDGFQVYRREVGSSTLIPIANLSALQTSMKDYGIRSRKAYEYLLGVYDSDKAFMGLVQATKPNIEPKQVAMIATNFKSYSLLVCDYDYDKDEYHVRKQYLFALNLSSGGVGNNNNPTLNANFTQYPTRMPSTQNYASGTLSGLIGAIYTVPALIEQIGQYKWTAKPSTLDYFDSVDLEKELYDLSTAPYQLFLRDMKGRLRMIHTNGAISMTTDLKQKQQSISISFPWVEVGDASDVTIIQTQDDYGWNNDNQVLDVQLDVDTATGELSAIYPFPYNGTKFYLTGVNKEMLTAKTHIEVTPAQFELSDVAEKTTDGEVAATVTVNSEENV